MSTKRQLIESLRGELREISADSTYTNQFLYNELVKHAKWLIRREVRAGRIYVNNAIFQTLNCVEVIETSTIDPCCPVKVNCKIYRTKNKLPEMWADTYGPILGGVTSVDGSTIFFYTNSVTWQAKRKDPYQKMIDTKYSFFGDGYLWFPDYNPHRVNISGFYLDDLELLEVDECEECQKKPEPCTRFLDTKFQIPEWLEAEMVSNALQTLAGISKRLPEDEQIDKNPEQKGIRNERG